MPPSGFNQKAINGLLEYVQEQYQSAQERCGDVSEAEYLLQTASELEASVSDMSPGQQGLHTFVAECFRDLAQEIHEGKDKYGRQVINGYAIEKELQQLKDYLTDFTL